MTKSLPCSASPRLRGELNASATFGSRGKRQELAKESAYRERHGTEWKVRYAVEQGSLVEARVKVAVEIIGAVTIVGIGIWLYRMVLPALRGEGYASYSPGKRHRKRKRHLQTPRSPAPETMIASTTAKAFVPPHRESSAPPKIRRMDDADSRGQTT